MTATRASEAQADLLSPEEDIPAGASVARREPAGAVQASSGVATAMQLLQQAITAGIPVESIRELVKLSNEQADRAAAQEFNAALASFQAECPPIAKSSKASITTKSGVKYSYQYAELDQIATHIRPYLKPRGLSYGWDSSIDKNVLTCVCTLRHTNGHSVKASFTCPVDAAAHMSEQQKAAAALSYARRQSLVQVLGLTTCDPDTDGSAGASDTITDSQEADLEALMQEVHADRLRFLKYMEVESLGEIRAVDFASAVAALEAKRRSS